MRRALKRTGLTLLVVVLAPVAVWFAHDRWEEHWWATCQATEAGYLAALHNESADVGRWAHDYRMRCGQYAYLLH
ncbi:MAG TPA: hypothetical protein VE953_11975 [Terriglobales bacterium]|nr:hypothetical protein [Terriglobales bacterium]